jgi:hypothetical protein
MGCAALFFLIISKAQRPVVGLIGFFLYVYLLKLLAVPLIGFVLLLPLLLIYTSFSFVPFYMPHSTINLITRSNYNTSAGHVFLFKPKEEHANHICSITLEHIGCNPDTLLNIPITASVGPVAAKPLLTAARLPCNHTFNAMALVVHLAKNNLQCPMCRKGSPHDRLDLNKTFPGEPWVTAVEASICASHCVDPIATHMSGRVFFNPSSNAIEQIPIHAAFVMYSRPSEADHPSHRLPSIPMRCRMEVVHDPFFSVNDMTLSSWFSTMRPPSLRYRLPSAFARLLQNQMQDMTDVMFNVHVFATFAGTVFTMAHMRSTHYPLTADSDLDVEPSSELMSFSRPHQHPAVENFIYTPSQNSIITIFTLLQSG